MALEVVVAAAELLAAETTRIVEELTVENPRTVETDDPVPAVVAIVVEVAKPVVVVDSSA